MLHKLKLTNFQNHTATQIDFSPGVTVITGPSDQGKSAIIRALGWLLFNKPAGDGFRREGAKEVSVFARFNDCNIRRTRTSKDNTYDRNVGGMNLKFAAVRTDVPVEVQDAVRVSDYQVHNQHDAHFLLQDSPGEVARRLNTLVGLDLDPVFRRVNTIVSRAARDQEDAAQQIATIEQSLQHFEYIEQAEDIVSALEELEKGAAQKRAQLRTIRSALSRYETAVDDLSRCKDTAEAEKIVDALSGVVARREQLSSKKEDILRILAQIGASTAQMPSDEQIADLEARVREAEAAAKICPTCKRPWEGVA